MVGKPDNMPQSDPGPSWVDIQARPTLAWLLPRKTRIFGLLMALGSVVGAFATYVISGFVLITYSRISGDPLPQSEMVVVGMFSLLVYAALLVAFCYGLAVLLTGRLSTAFWREDS